jgi:hypothetical protein
MMHGIAWVFNRELSARVGRPHGYADCGYGGVLTPVLLLGLIAVPASICYLPQNFTAVLAWVYALYLGYAAGRLGAGALAADRGALPSLPASASSVVAGKLLAALLPLWLESLLAMPVWALLASYATLPSGLVLGYFCTIQAVIWTFGVWGLHFAFRSASLDEAWFRARWFTHMIFWLLPLALIPLSIVAGPMILVVACFNPLSVIVGTSGMFGAPFGWVSLCSIVLYQFLIPFMLLRGCARRIH